MSRKLESRSLPQIGPLKGSHYFAPAYLGDTTEVTHPPKARLIICCDGTASSEYIDHKRSPLTNVSRITRAIDQWDKQIRQTVKYLPGIGTDERTIHELNRFNQASGKGLKSLILEAYSFLSHNWATEDDEIILIGFSRGAFAMRCLADFVLKFGLLTKKRLDSLHELYDFWKGGHSGLGDRQCVKIKVCALWDTVATVKNLVPRPEEVLPFSVERQKFRFVNSDLLVGIENAFQALSLHEHRYHFLPIVWKKVRDDQNLEQCWFAGYHGDIGGGGKNDVLSHFALVWIIEKLRHFVSISVDQLWADQDPSSWSIPKGREIDVRDPRTFGWKALESMSRKSKYLNFRYRRPRYHFTNDRGIDSSAREVKVEASEERIHFSAGFLQHHKTFKSYGPSVEFRPNEKEFNRTRQTRSWILRQPEQSRFPWLRNRSRNRVGTYEVEEQNLGSFEVDVLSRWTKDQLRKLQRGAVLGDSSDTILGILKAYLEYPPPDD